MITPPTRCYLGLGSNLDNPQDQVRRAVDELAGLPESSLVGTSPLYRSRAIGPEQPDYINAVAALDTTLSPLALLDQLQGIEAAHDRQRLIRWGPRTLDIDILLYGNLTLNSERLTLPHTQLSLRNFVLMPLLDIAPDLHLPDGRALCALTREIGSDGIEQLE